MIEEAERLFLKLCLKYKNSLFTNKAKKAFFKKNVTIVGIEIFSFCNRQCWFCPNSIIDRHSKNIFLDENLYLKVIKELSQIDYDQLLTYSMYAEPLADKIILTRIKQARKYLPNAIIITNTNSDYLTREYLDELAEAGLNKLRVQCYLDEDETFSEEIVKFKMQKLIDKLGLKYKVVFNNESIYQILFDFEPIEIIYYARDFRKTGTNRGDSITTINKVKRIEPCYLPKAHLMIDYKGYATPCCNLRPDIEAHKDFIIGNIKNNTIFEIFTNKKIIELRRHLEKVGEKIHPCNTCNFCVGFKPEKVVRG